MTTGLLLSLDAYRSFIMICLTWGGFRLGKFSELKMQAHPDSGWWRFFHTQFDHGPWAGWGLWDLITRRRLHLLAGRLVDVSKQNLRSPLMAWHSEPKVGR